jgi:hypothetical protein
MGENMTKETLIKEILDWQVDLQIKIYTLKALNNMTVEQLQDIIKYFEDSSSN